MHMQTQSTCESWPFWLGKHDFPHYISSCLELLAQDLIIETLGLPLGLEAPIMTSNSVTFLFLFIMESTKATAQPVCIRMTLVLGPYVMRFCCSGTC